MAIIDAQWQPKEQHCWNGVQYDFSIYDRGNGVFQAAWVCSSCGREGVLAPVGESIDEVLRLARIGARIHHQLLHDDILTPKDLLLPASVK
jgi:predicted RNase H-like HicB family nuclease